MIDIAPICAFTFIAAMNTVARLAQHTPTAMRPVKALQPLAWLLFVLSGAYFMLHFQDDAFIHLRYARNLLELKGVYYNAGQPSYGTSSPLFLYLLAALMQLGITSFWTTKVVSLVFQFILITQFLWMSTRAAGHQRLILAAITLLLCMPMSARWLNNGMETSLIAVLATTAGLASLRDKDFAWGFAPWMVMSFLACTTRVEFFALFTLITATLLLQGKASLKPKLGGITAGACLSALHYLLVFGGLTPDTAVAKSHGFSLMAGLTSFATISISVVGNIVSATTLGLAMASILIFSSIHAARNKTLQAPLILAWLGFIGLIFLIAARGQAIQGVRYFVFIIFYFAALLLPSTDAAPVTQAKNAAAEITPWMIGLVGVVFCIDAALAWPVVAGRSRTTLAFIQQPVNEAVNKPCVGYDIGYFTYFTGCRIFDMAGLVNGRTPATLATEQRLQTFVGTNFELAFLNTEQIDTLTSSGAFDIREFTVIGKFEFPNVGYWHSKDADTHFLFKRNTSPLTLTQRASHQ